MVSMVTRTCRGDSATTAVNWSGLTMKVQSRIDSGMSILVRRRSRYNNPPELEKPQLLQLLQRQNKKMLSSALKASETCNLILINLDKASSDKDVTQILRVHTEPVAYSKEAIISWPILKILSADLHFLRQFTQRCNLPNPQTRNAVLHLSINS